jgi:SAM-dependent methyltransferase
MDIKSRRCYDLGCGSKIKEGFAGIDFEAYEGVEFVKNLDDENLRLPFNDSEVDEFYASHFLEHIHHLVPLLNEVWRCLKPTGRFDIIVPLAPSRAAFDDPDHKRFFTKGTFSYFTENPPGNYRQKGLKGLWTILLNDWTPAYSEDTAQVYTNEMRELHVIMTPNKHHQYDGVEINERPPQEEKKQENIVKGVFHVESGGNYAKADN